MPEEIFTYQCAGLVEEGATCSAFNTFASERTLASWDLAHYCRDCDSCEALCAGCGYCAACECRCRTCGCGTILGALRNVTEEICIGCGAHKGCKLAKCECTFCSWCGKGTGKACGSCGAASDGCECCKCWECRECGKKTSGAHSDCDKCSSCCTPTKWCSQCKSRGEETASRVPFFRSDLTFWRPGVGQTRDWNKHAPTWLQVRRDSKRNKSVRALSAEIEVANVSRRANVDELVDLLRSWGASVVEDGSLPNTGFEINTAPAGGDYWHSQINGICRALKAAGGGITSKCGCHVHVDARSLGWWDVRRLVHLYVNLEDSLFKLVHPDRRTGRFSVLCAEKLRPILSSRDPKALKRYLPKQIMKVVDNPKNRRRNGVELKRKYGAKEHNDSTRYNALNLKSWFLRGTVEFRHLHGTIDPTEIYYWGKTCAALVDAAEFWTDREVQGIAGDDGLRELCTDRYHKRWVTNRLNRRNESTAGDHSDDGSEMHGDYIEEDDFYRR